MAQQASISLPAFAYHYLARTLEEPDDDFGFVPTLENIERSPFLTHNS